MYFYLAKNYQYKGDYSNAIALYKLSISLNVYEFSEHRYAFLELGRIFKSIQAERAEEAQKIAKIKIARRMKFKKVSQRHSKNQIINRCKLIKHQNWVLNTVLG